MYCDNPKCGKKIKGKPYRNCWSDFCNTECAGEACFQAQGEFHMIHKCKFGHDAMKKYPEMEEPAFF